MGYISLLLGGVVVVLLLFFFVVAVVPIMAAVTTVSTASTGSSFPKMTVSISVPPTAMACTLIPVQASARITMPTVMTIVPSAYVGNARVRW